MPPAAAPVIASPPLLHLFALNGKKPTCPALYSGAATLTSSLYKRAFATKPRQAGDLFTASLGRKGKANHTETGPGGGRGKEGGC